MRTARVPRLYDDELLSGFLVRLAHANGLNAWRFASLHWPSRPLWRRDVDRTGDLVWIEDVATLVGHTPDRLLRTTLQEPQAALGADGHGILPLFLVAGVYHSKRRHHGLQYCPCCLEEAPGVYLRAWRCALAVRCERHGVALRDGCPRCGVPLAPHRNQRLNRDVCSRCTSSLLLACQPEPAIPPEVVRLQRSVVPHLLNGCPKAVDTTHDLRALIAVLANVAVEDRLRSFLALDPRVERAGTTRVFERMRHADRLVILETAASWMNDWPTRFRAGAEAVGLNQLSFARRTVGVGLAEEIARLPERARAARRSPSPLVHVPLLRRLARVDGHAYRVQRAERLDRLSRP